ncbi:MAG TPA: hypothetical protein VIL69_19940 [Roseomonas sp.]|jgi:hypothetical protein
MNRHFEQEEAPKAGTGNSDLMRTIRSTRDLAEYARTQRFPGADELLTAVVAALLASSPERLHQELIAAEDRAIAAMRLMWEPTEPEE